MAIAVSLTAAGCGGDHKAGEPAEQPVVDARVVTVSATELPQIVEAGGIVRAGTTAAVTSRLLAPVLEVRVAPGDRVRAGQVLIRLDDRDLSAGQRRATSGRQAAEHAGRAAAAERDAAEAALALATAHHKRIAMLHERKSATSDELDQAVAGLRGAQSRLAATEARIAESAAGLQAATAGADAATVGASWAVITAPFDGIVTEKLVEAGNMAAPGMPLLRIEQAGALRLDVRLDESRASGFTPGQSVDVRFDAGVVRAATEAGGAPPAASDGAPDLPSRGDAGRSVAGRITEIARAGEAGAHAFLVKVELPLDVRVPSGAFARARFAGPTRRVLAVPRAAVVRRGQLTSVFVVDGEHARLRLVSTGAAAVGPSGQELVEVLAGLEDGERVIEAPSPLVRDGVRVRGAGSPRAAAAAGEPR